MAFRGERAPRIFMTLQETRKRWWWSDPARALRSAFPEKSSVDKVQKFVWPELERAAFNHELAARSSPGKPAPWNAPGRRCRSPTRAATRARISIGMGPRAVEYFCSCSYEIS